MIALLLTLVLVLTKTDPPREERSCKGDTIGSASRRGIKVVEAPWSKAASSSVSLLPAKLEGTRRRAQGPGAIFLLVLT